MTQYTRASAWNVGGTFENADLLWYAKGVKKMMGRALNDPASWWFFAAIHGEYVNPKNSGYPSPPAFPAWVYVQNAFTVPTTPLPSQSTQDKFWNQCQHGTWYFLPWHRGYLYALEAQLRADIVSQGGPANWALPFWNYFGGMESAEAQMPPAFSATTLPDGSPNPLYVTMRYGPDGGGDIYIPTAGWVAGHPADPNSHYGDVTDVCLQNDIYTGADALTKSPGFGGPHTMFSHSGGSAGNMEANPHNLVHVYVGGYVNSQKYGLMADPGTAALDPIFYLHHCNIDRMWAAWNDAGNANSSDADWLNGPVQTFVMPFQNKEPWAYTPASVQNLASLNYVYQEAAPAAASAESLLAGRMRKLGASNVAGLTKSLPLKTAQPQRVELLGANVSPVRIYGMGGASFAVQLHPDVQQRVVGSLKLASPSALPDTLYLKLENVRGTQDATVLRVYANLPAQADPATTQAQFVGSVALFGLRRASVQDGTHGGAGLTFILDISDHVDQMYLENKLASGEIKISFLPSNDLPQSTSIEVGRVSIYRQPN